MDSFFLIMALAMAPIFLLYLIFELLHFVVSRVRKKPKENTPGWVALKFAGSFLLGVLPMGVVMVVSMSLSNNDWKAIQLKALAQPQYGYQGKTLGPLSADETARVVQNARDSYKGKTTTAANICSVDSLFAARLEYRFTLAQYNQLRDTTFAQQEAIRCRVMVSVNDAERSVAVLTKRFPLVVKWVGVVLAKFGTTDEAAATKSLHEWMAEGVVANEGEVNACTPSTGGDMQCVENAI